MPWKNLREEIEELFAEEAPTVLGKYLHGLRCSTPLALKHARSAAWNAAHPLKCREATKKYKAKKAKERKKKLAKRKADKAYRSRNPELKRAKRAAQVRKWREANPEAWRDIQAKSRAKHPYKSTGKPRGRPVKSMTPHAIYLRAWKLKQKA